MGSNQHVYELKVEWTGNTGSGTSSYKSYERSHTIHISGKEDILCSSEPSFRGDNTKHNPEELFVASIAACHMLWYLHLCSDNGINVHSYTDEATAIMETDSTGSGRFTNVTLHPVIKITDHEMLEKAKTLHEEAHEKCFIANSCNFPITHEPQITIA